MCVQVLAGVFWVTLWYVSLTVVTVKWQGSHHCLGGFIGSLGCWVVWLFPIYVRKLPYIFFIKKEDRKWKAQASVSTPFQHKGPHRLLCKQPTWQGSENQGWKLCFLPPAIVSVSVDGSSARGTCLPHRTEKGPLSYDFFPLYPVLLPIFLLPSDPSPRASHWISPRLHFFPVK